MDRPSRSYPAVRRRFSGAESSLRCRTAQPLHCRNFRVVWPIVVWASTMTDSEAVGYCITSKTAVAPSFVARGMTQGNCAGRCTPGERFAARPTRKCGVGKFPKVSLSTSLPPEKVTDFSRSRARTTGGGATVDLWAIGGLFGPDPWLCVVKSRCRTTFFPSIFTFIDQELKGITQILSRLMI